MSKSLYALCDIDEAESFKPTVVLLEENNNIEKILDYV